MLHFSALQYTSPSPQNIPQRTAAGCQWSLQGCSIFSHHIALQIRLVTLVRWHDGRRVYSASDLVTAGGPSAHSDGLLSLAGIRSDAATWLRRGHADWLWRIRKTWDRRATLQQRFRAVFFSLSLPLFSFAFCVGSRGWYKLVRTGGWARVVHGGRNTGPIRTSVTLHKMARGLLFRAKNNL